MKEREIDLCDLLCDVLLHWRSIIVIAVICGLLMGGYSYVKSASTLKQQMEINSMPNKQEIFEDKLTDLQIINVNEAVYYDQRIEREKAYWGESALTKTNPVQMVESDIVFLIQSDDLERTYNIQKVYEELLTSTELYNYVEEQCSIQEHVNELITLSSSDEKEKSEKDSIKVEIFYGDEDQCRAMAAAVVDYVQQQQKKLTEVLGVHEVKLLSMATGFVTDGQLLEKQQEISKNIRELDAYALNLKNQFTEDQWEYYKYLTKQESSSADKNETMSATTEPTSFSIKYVLIGMLLAVCAYGFGLCLIYVMSDKLKVVDDMHSLYGISQFGVVKKQETKNRKRFLRGIDEKILALRYRGLHRFSVDETLELTIVAVKMAVKKQELHSICLIGCNLIGNSLDVCEKIKDILTAENINVCILNNILYNAEELEKIENSQGTVLVETAGSTLYEEIQSELDILKRQNLTVLGGVVVE